MLCAQSLEKKSDPSTPPSLPPHSNALIENKLGVVMTNSNSASRSWHRVSRKQEETSFIFEPTIMSSSYKKISAKSADCKFHKNIELNRASFHPKY